MSANRVPSAQTFSDTLPGGWARVGLVLILLAYVLIGSLYALWTPVWQTPDEPAHVNYARHVARTGRLPVLQPGDYDAAYLEALKAARFPPHMPVTSVRYESHQPPLYYVVAALLLRATAPDALSESPPYPAMARAVYTMRFLSLTFGLVLLLAVYGAARTLFPGYPSWALAATAMVAFIPQHVAMMAAANNDAMAEMWLALWLWVLLRSLQAAETPPAFKLALLLGLLLLTKTTVYLPALLALAGWAIALPSAARGKGLRTAGVALLGGLLVASPFYLRNLLVYGWPDVLGWRRHAAVVVGQMTTAEFVAQHGWRAYWERAFTWTFRSFWGQFGWMGVLMDERVYRGLLYFSLLAAAGSILFLRKVAVSGPSSPILSAAQRRSYLVLAAAAAGVLIAYAGYNTRFLQHQGRYLFPALLPLASVVMPGLWTLLEPRYARRAAVACGVMAIGVLAAAAVDLGPFTRWDALSWLLQAVWLVAAAAWPRGRPLWLLLPWIGLAPFSVWVLWRFIVPALA